MCVFQGAGGLPVGAVVGIVVCVVSLLIFILVLLLVLWWRREKEEPVAPMANPSGQTITSTGVDDQPPAGTTQV